MNKQHRNAAGSCNIDMQTPCARPLLSGFGLWNQISSVVRQRGAGARICIFYFALGVFFLAVFFRTPVLFFATRLGARKRGKILQNQSTLTVLSRHTCCLVFLHFIFLELRQNANILDICTDLNLVES
jgi:hypothetical protein